MPEYICKNKDCSEFEISQNEPSTKIIIRDGKAVDLKAVCPTCGEERFSPNDGGVPVVHGRRNVPL